MGGQGQKKQANPTRASATHAVQSGLLRLRSKQGLEIVVGRNARQNERVTFQEAHPDDLWLHAKDVPGSHVVIFRPDGSDYTEEVIRYAAALAAGYSRAESAPKAEVDYTLRRHVKKPNGAALGFVRYILNNQTVLTHGLDDTVLRCHATEDLTVPRRHDRLKACTERRLLVRFGCDGVAVLGCDKHDSFWPTVQSTRYVDPVRFLAPATGFPSGADYIFTFGLIRSGVPYFPLAERYWLIRP